MSSLLWQTWRKPKSVSILGARRLNRGRNRFLTGTLEECEDRVLMANVSLGTAGNFSVLAGSTVTNTGPSVIDGGSVGVSPGSAITGFPPGSVKPPFTTHAADAVALQAQNDLTTAYNAAAGLVHTQDLTGQNLGGLTLVPGVYFFSSSAQLTGTLTLNDQGDPNAQFVFQIGSTLTTASNSSVVTINGGSMPGCNVFWQVGSSATLGTGTAFEGHILALTSITLNTSATILDGSALARNGAVTLDTNTITNCVSSSVVPGPPTIVGASRFGFHAQPTILVLSFNQPLDVASAEDTANYSIVTQGRNGQFGGRGSHHIAVHRALFDASTDTVTLLPHRHLSLFRLYQLTVNGHSPSGVKNTSGLLLDGQGTGRPGSDFVTILSAKNLHRLPQGPLGLTSLVHRRAESHAPR